MKQLRISPSMLERLSKCDTRTALVAEGYELPEPRIAAEIGTLGHAAIERYFNRQDIPTILEAFEYGYSLRDAEGALGDATLRDAEYGMQNMRLILNEWFTRHPLEQLPIVIEAVEVPFDLPIGTIQVGKELVEVRLIGQLDAIGVDPGGYTWVWENKFTRKRLDARYRNTFRMTAQTAAYIWAASQVFGRPVAGCFLNAVQVAKVPDSNRKCRLHGTPYLECGLMHLRQDLFPVDRPSDTLAIWRRELMAFASDYYNLLQRLSGGGGPHAERIQGMFRGDCEYCEGFAYCASGKDPDVLRDTYVRVPHDPNVVSDRPRSGLRDAA